MARDYAKARSGDSGAAASRGRARGKASATRAAPASGGGWRLYGAGVATGMLLSLLLYLVTLPAETEPGTATAAATATVPGQVPPKPRFDFYTMLPEQVIEVGAEPAATAQAPEASSAPWYLLQAGSFKTRDDADRRRAELLLLGLEPKIEATDSDNGRWFRVFLGPFESRTQMTRARSLTTAQSIDTLLLKRDRP